MWFYTLTLGVFLAQTYALNLEYLDPTKLQTEIRPEKQQEAALNIIKKYTSRIEVQVNPILFNDKKDLFSLRSSPDNRNLHIKASSGVAAVWGFNYYLKKYCNSHIGWQVKNVRIPLFFPEVDEVVTANDRFRYYQNVCTGSYSYLWWSVQDWIEHIDWMALNGINLALAPFAQEDAWTRIYKKLGMTSDEIDEHFTGPAFLAWLRMGNVRGWGGPLLRSWHDAQRAIQDQVLDYMFKLGMVPIVPAFNGHVPRAFARLYPNSTFYNVGTWGRFGDDYCCGLFLDPNDPLFNHLGHMFLRAVTATTGRSHVYTADPFNEIIVKPWTTSFVQDTAKAIIEYMTAADSNAVWLLQNWMFVNDPLLWPRSRVEAFFGSVPQGRMLVLDLQSEQWPQYELYQMYFGHPFIWCMLHNFGGTLGMFGNMKVINNDPYRIRAHVNSTMVGIGLTPEGINQNYVMYDLMLETSWRSGPVNLDSWVQEYGQRRYSCNATNTAWKYLLRSVYNFHGLNRVRGKYVITRRPSLKIRPWAWYRSHDLFEAWKQFAFATKDPTCSSPGFLHDLVDVTRQALQYRAEQLYESLINSRTSNTWVVNSTISRFLNAMEDIEQLLASNEDFTAEKWLSKARSFAKSSNEEYLYELNARNQITLWGPNGEITDYACKQWAELFHHYYIPRWRTFLQAFLTSKFRGEKFDEKRTQQVVRETVEQAFATVPIDTLPKEHTLTLVWRLYEKWAMAPGLPDLPQTIIYPDLDHRTTLPDTDVDAEDYDTPTVTMLQSTTKAKR